jgi:hypothetical protein
MLFFNDDIYFAILYTILRYVFKVWNASAIKYTIPDGTANLSEHTLQLIASDALQLIFKDFIGVLDAIMMVFV